MSPKKLIGQDMDQYNSGLTGQRDMDFKKEVWQVQI